MIKQVGALAHHAVRVVFDSFDGNLTGLLDDLAGKLSVAGLQQLEGARIGHGRYLANCAIELFSSTAALAVDTPVEEPSTESSKPDSDWGMLIRPFNSPVTARTKSALPASAGPL